MERMRVVRLKSPYTVSGMIKGDAMKKLIVLVLCFLLITAPALAAIPLGTADLVAGSIAIGPPGAEPPFYPGMAVLYIVTIWNDGPDIAHNAWIRLDFRPGEQPRKGDDYCTEPEPGQNWIMCNPGDISVHGSTTVQIVVIITHYNYLPPCWITAGSDENDPTPINGYWGGLVPYSIFLPVAYK